MRLRADGVSWRRTGEAEVVVLDLDRGEYFALNASAVLLWETLAAGPVTAEELTDLLVSTYRITVTRATADVGGFLATLTDHSLLEAGPGVGPG